ncbi:ArsR/SmtB family transcription factor [Aurantimonas marina]|uniref:ArsR/SmtB family transcription factor n=1 Tax=Aurantimonas marina TaxID=2780508 RepID=UPI001AEEDB1B|nr:metalloregulator ArsR/SmtB family transcription factor [Aurantimonas marina]
MLDIIVSFHLPLAVAYEKILTAFADPTRRALLEDLRAGPMPVARLAERHPVSRPAVSQHLKVLEAAGLVTAEARGTARFYRVRPQGLAPLRAYLDEIWGDVLQAFADEVDKQMEQDDAGTRDQDN